MEEKTYSCENCRLRAKYDENPKSLVSRVWHWHLGFCPGWKKFFNSRTEEQKEELRRKYALK